MDGPNPDTRRENKVKEQELRGEVRELLSSALLRAGAYRKDEVMQNYIMGKAAALREVLELMNREDI